MEERECENCGKSLEGKKSGARYCSANCRASHHAAKKKAGYQPGLNGIPGVQPPYGVPMAANAQGLDPMAAILINQEANQKQAVINERDQLRQQLNTREETIRQKDTEINRLSLEIVNLKNKAQLDQQAHAHQIQLNGLEHANKSGLNGFLDQAQANPEAFANAAATLLDSIKGMNTQAAVDVTHAAADPSLGGVELDTATMQMVQWFQSMEADMRNKFLQMLHNIKKTGFKAESVLDEINQFITNGQFSQPLPTAEGES